MRVQRNIFQINMYLKYIFHSVLLRDVHVLQSEILCVRSHVLTALTAKILSCNKPSEWSKLTEIWIPVKQFLLIRTFMVGRGIIYYRVYNKPPVSCAIKGKLKFFSCVLLSFRTSLNLFLWFCFSCICLQIKFVSFLAVLNYISSFSFISLPSTSPLSSVPSEWL